MCIEEHNFEERCRTSTTHRSKGGWAQDRVANGELSIVKVSGEEHASDGLAKHVDRQKMEQHVDACGMVRRSGRHELIPQLGEFV